MSTRWYLHATESTLIGRPSASAASGVTDSDNGDVSRLFCRELADAVPPGPATVAEWTDAPAADDEKYWLIGLWVGPALAKQTLDAGATITVTSAVAEQGTGGSNIHAAAYAYLWRSGQGRVAELLGLAGIPAQGGYELDGTDPEIAWRAVSATIPADIPIAARDRIVVELWACTHAEAPPPPGHWRKVGWGGSTLYNEGDEAPDPAAYFESSQTLTGGTEMSVTVTNLLVGARNISVGGTDIGATAEGVDLEYTREYIEHEIDQRLGVVAVDKTKERATLKFTMAEPSLENLRLAMDQPSTALSEGATSDELVVGGDWTASTAEVTVTGKAPGTNKTRTITAYKALFLEGGTHSYKKDGKTVVECTLLLVEDQTKPLGKRLLSIKDADGAFAFV